MFDGVSSVWQGNVCHRCGIAVKKKVCHWCVMARDDLHFRLRIPEALKAKIEASALENHRSMTAEIVDRLETSYEPQYEKDDQIEWLNAYIERQNEEKSALIEALNSQDKILERLNESHKTLMILARSVGEAILTDGDRSDFVKVLAAGLVDMQIDVLSDAENPDDEGELR